MSLVKYSMEFVVHASPSLLFDKLSSPTGLQEWFADTVNCVGKEYIFTWEGTDEVAKLLAKRNEDVVRFKWNESGDDESYFEFKIQVDDLTNDVSIMLTDFADTEDEVEEAKDLWNTQIDTLKKVIGA